VSKTNTVESQKISLPNVVGWLAGYATKYSSRQTFQTTLSNKWYFSLEGVYCITGALKTIRQCFPRHSGKCGVYSLQRVNDQLLLIHSVFCTKHDYIPVMQF